MARRSRYKERSKIWPWVSFVVFGLVATLLGYSVIKKESPAAVLKSIFASDLQEDDVRRLSKSELVALAEEQSLKLAELEGALQSCQAGDGYQKGVIKTSSPTLNLRSEASLESDVLIKIPVGSQVSIVYYDDRELLLDGAMGRWCRIKYADQEGWAWGNYVEKL